MRHFTLLLLAVAASLGAFAAPRTLDYATGKFSENGSASVPVRTITENTGGYEVSYTISSALIEEDRYNPGSFKWLIPGFNEVLAPGEPAFLSRRDKFQIPVGYIGSVELVSCEYKDFDIQLAASQEVLYDNSKNVSTTFTPVKAYSGYLPSEPVAFLCTNKYRGRDILELGVYPIQYNYQEKKVRALTKIVYKVTLSQVASPIKSNSKISLASDSDDPFLNNICLNKIGVSNDGRKNGISIGGSNPPIMRNETYIIVSTTKFKTAVEKFAKWKNKLGFTTQILYGSWQNSDDVKAAINDVANNPKYLLIIGDSEDVPGENMGTYVSDRPYAFFEWNDGDEADLLYGRLPVSTLEEANTVVDKIINYEKSPSTSENMYSRVINCSNFDDNGIYGVGINDGKEDRRFAQTSEEISEYLNNTIKKDVGKYFNASSNVNPQKWYEPKLADVTVPSGISTDLIDRNMRKPYYPWNYTATHIKNDWNSNGAIYVMHRGHGGYNAWAEPNFTVTDASSLTNANKLPVVFSINCLTGRYNGQTCLAEALLRNSNGGGVAVFAASASTSTYMNNIFAQGIINSIWPNPGIKAKFKDDDLTNTPFNNLPTTPVYRLGQIHQQAIAMVCEAFGYASSAATSYLGIEKYSYHCFGDPSMMIRTEVPVKATCQVSSEGDFIIINPEEGCELGVYIPSTNFTNIISGSNITLLYEDYKTAVFTVYGPNKIPFTFYGSRIIRNARNKKHENTTVREDRIWQYAAYNNMKSNINVPVGRIMPEGAQLVNMRFSGTTDISGKTYYNCYVYDAGSEFRATPNTLYAYVREEDGRIYSLWNSGGTAFQHFPLADYTYYIIEKAYDTAEEVLSYDFNLAENESYQPLDSKFISELVVWEPALKGAGTFDWTVGKKTTEYVGNEPVSAFDMVSTADKSKYLFKFVEGVGRVSGACDFMPMPVRQMIVGSFMCDCPAGEEEWPVTMYFNNLYDLDGNILYKGANLESGERLPQYLDVSGIQDSTNGEDVYGIDGMLKIRNASPEDIRRLSSGVYIIGGRKVMIRK